MKKNLLIIPIVMLSCSKETAVSSKKSADSMNMKVEDQVTVKKDSVNIQDSIVNNSPVTKEVLREGIMREEKDNKIIRITDASQMPFTIGEEFTREGQKFWLRIQNFDKKTISVDVKPEREEQNIRINQLFINEIPLGGPYGRSQTETINQKGEIIVEISRSNMASGSDIGHFSVSVK